MENQDKNVGYNCHPVDSCLLYSFSCIERVRIAIAGDVERLVWFWNAGVHKTFGIQSPALKQTEANSCESSYASAGEIGDDRLYHRI